MPKATETTTTTPQPRGVNPITGPVILPSPWDLARVAGALINEQEQLHDSALLDGPGLSAAKNLNLDRREAIEALAASLPAMTAADGLGQLVIAFRLADHVGANVINETEGQDTVHSIRRLLISAVPPVAKALGLDLAAIGGAKIADLRVWEFALVDGIGRDL